MKLQGLVGFVAGAVAIPVVAFSETNEWRGASGAAWGEPANWSLQRVPAATDWVKFTTAVTVAPPADFTGVFWVSGAKVAATVSETTRFSLKLDGTDAGFTKSGAGVLTVQPCRGVNPGTVTVASGEMDFAGNGEEAPGAFDKLSVAAGAKARVVESPIATRHGAIQHGGYSTGTLLPEGFTTPYYNWYTSGNSAMADYIWDSWFCCSTRVSRVYVPEGFEKPLLYKNLGTPAELLAFPDATVIFHRAIILGETPKAGHYTIQSGGDGSGVMTSVFLDGDCWWSAYWKSTYDKNYTISRGWHELKTTHWAEGKTYGWKVGWQAFSRTSSVPEDSGRITEDMLWLGVCFNAIDLAAGGEIAIADGQALGLSMTENLKLDGTFRGESANAMLSLMSSYETADMQLTGLKPLTGLDSFGGKIELGRSTVVRLPDNAAAASYTILGKGKVQVASGTESRFGSDFTGTFVVPEGVSFTLPEATANRVEGAGRVVLATGTKPMDAGAFTGTKELNPASAAYTLADVVGARGADAPELKDGATYTLRRVKAVHAVEGTAEMPPLSDTTAWKFMGAYENANMRIVAPDGTIFPLDPNKLPYFGDNGELVMVDACDKCRRGVYLTGMPIKEGDSWGCEFDLHVYIPTPSPYAGQHGWPANCDNRSGAFGVILCDGNPGAKFDANKTFMAWDGSCGFHQAYWTTGTWTLLHNGHQQTEGLTSQQAGGIDLTQPYHIAVTGRNGAMTVRMTQGAKSYERIIDVRRAFQSGFATLGIFASGDNWGEKQTGMPWARIEVSNFSGYKSVPAEPRISTDDEPDARMALTADNWVVSSQAVFADGVLKLITTEENYKYGHAICKTPVSSRQAFEVEYDVTYTKSASSGTATLQAFLLQTEGTAPTFTHSGNGFGCFDLKNTPSYGFATQTYDNYMMFVSSKGDTTLEQDRHAGKTLTISANVANHVKLIYDGMGGMHVVYQSNGKTDDSFYAFADLADLDQDVYLTFSIGTTWAPCGKVSVSNFKFTPRTATFADVKLGGLSVAAGNSATVKLPDATGTASGVFGIDRVKLGTGAALSVAPMLDGAAVEVGEVESAGAATLNVAADSVVTYGGFAFTGTAPYALSLAGAGKVAFADPLAFRIPEAWSHKPTFALVDYSEATLEGDGPEARPLANEDGAAIKRGQVSDKAKVFTYERNGMLIIFR